MDNYVKREDVPWSDDQLRAFYAAWLVVHVKRFDTPTFPSKMTNHEVFCWQVGIRDAEKAINDVAGINLGITYGWFGDLVRIKRTDEQERRVRDLTARD